MLAPWRVSTPPKLSIEAEHDDSKFGIQNIEDPCWFLWGVLYWFFVGCTILTISICDPKRNLEMGVSKKTAEDVIRSFVVLIISTSIL